MSLDEGVLVGEVAVGRVDAGGGGRTVIREVVLTPPFTSYPSEMGFTLLKPSIATVGRFVISRRPCLVRWHVRKLYMDRAGIASKIETGVR